MKNKETTQTNTKKKKKRREKMNKWKTQLKVPELFHPKAYLTFTS